MFFRTGSNYHGTPPRLYREPEEISRDIGEIRRRISSADLRLNARSIIAEMICAQAGREPEKWIPAMMAIIEDAGDTLDELKRLTAALEMLKYELEETKCVLTS